MVWILNPEHLVPYDNVLAYIFSTMRSPLLINVKSDYGGCLHWINDIDNDVVISPTLYTSGNSMQMVRIA